MAMNDDVMERRFPAEALAPYVGERVDVVLARLLERSRSRVQALLKAGGGAA